MHITLNNGQNTGQPKYCYIKNNTRCFKSALQQSLDFSFSVLYILADQISFLETQSLQLAGFSSTVFTVNLILNYRTLTQIRGSVLVARTQKFIILQNQLDITKAVFSLNFSSAGKGPLLTGKAKNMRHWCALQALLACMKAFIFEHPVNQFIEKYFKQLKTKNFTNEG